MLRKSLALTLLLVISTVTTAAETVLLDCHDFEHSDTVRVTVVYDDQLQEAVLIETMRNGQAPRRTLTTEELDLRAFKISPIFGYDRIITKKDNVWMIAYGCGEDRELNCSENFDIVPVQ